LTPVPPDAGAAASDAVAALMTDGIWRAAAARAEFFTKSRRVRGVEFMMGKKWV
jgi:hypothetical protein